MAKLLGFLQDGEDNYSSTRLAFLAWTLGVLVVWVWNRTQPGSTFELDKEATYILGILTTGKVAQAATAERARNESKTTTSSTTADSLVGLNGEFKTSDGKTITISNGLVKKFE